MRVRTTGSTYGEGGSACATRISGMLAGTNWYVSPSGALAATNWYVSPSANVSTSLFLSTSLFGQHPLYWILREYNCRVFSLFGRLPNELPRLRLIKIHFSGRALIRLSARWPSVTHTSVCSALDNVVTLARCRTSVNNMTNPSSLSHVMQNGLESV